MTKTVSPSIGWEEQAALDHWKALEKAKVEVGVVLTVLDRAYDHLRYATEQCRPTLGTGPFLAWEHDLCVLYDKVGAYLEELEEKTEEARREAAALDEHDYMEDR